MTSKIPVAFAILFASPAAFAQVDQGTDQVGVVEPEPGEEELRALSPHESAYTVNPGHLQVEVDAASMTLDNGSRAYGLASLRLKAGLTSFLDVQVLYDSFLDVDDHLGVGDLTLRTNWNLWGNDGGATAFSLMPFLVFPTATEGMGALGFEGGLIPVLAIGLPGDFGLSLIPELDFVRTRAATRASSAAS